MTKIGFSLVAVALASLATAEEPQWFKGNTHTHSLWSDGNDFPDRITAWYAAQGYHFLGMSDHNVLNRGERWVKEVDVEKKKKALGRKVLEKYVEQFGEDWVETRTNAEGEVEIRLKPLDQ